jgi:hypothetical protein
MSTGVLLAFHNHDMESFSVFPQRLRLVEAESASDNALPGARQEEAAREPPAETSSRLGALLVILAPFAVAAWVAIGFFGYRLLT